VWRSAGQVNAELAQQAERVGDRVAFDDLPVYDAVDLESSDPNPPAGRSDTLDLALVGAGERPAMGDEVPSTEHLAVLETEVREGVAVQRDELVDALGAGRNLGSGRSSLR
jgi:hypothetical protein